MSQQINLVNPAFRRVRDLLTTPFVGGAALVCLLAIVAMALWANHGASQRETELAALQPQVKQQQDELAALTREVSAPQRNAALEAELAAVSAQLQSREDVLRLLAGNGVGQRGGYADTLSALARQSMSGLWLTQFSIADGSGELTLRGRTLEPAQLPAYIHRLNAEKALQGRSFADMTMKDSSLAAAAPGRSEVPAAVPQRHYTEFVLSSGKGGAEAPTAGAKP